MKATTLILASICILLLPAAAAVAQGTALAPSTVHVIDPSSNVVWIGGTNDPINGPNPQPIDLDPNGLPWRKAITVAPNATFGGGPLFLRETIINTGTEAWTDWHEILLNGTHGVVWGGISDLRVNGTSISFNTNLTPNTIDVFDFSTLVQPGDILEIDKTIEALTDNVAGPGESVAFVLQYPTTIPEPTTAILCLAGVAVVSCRRARSA